MVTCRTCASSVVAHCGVFESIVVDGVEVLVNEMIQLVCGLKPDPQDSLPDFLCIDCFMMLKTAYAFRNRTRASDVHHRNPPPVVHQSISSKLRQIRIKKSPTIDSKEHFICDACNKCYLTKSTLIEHIKTTHDTIKHSRTKPIPKLTIKLHKIKHDINKPQYVCNNCGKHTTTRIGIIRHIRRFHDKYDFVCGFCDKKFTKKRNLEMHKLKHVNKQCFRCQTCNKPYASKDGLAYHTRQNRCFKMRCSCGKVFEDKKKYLEHSQNVHGRVHQCEVCDIVAKTGYALKHHMFAVHGRSKKYECTLCNASFELLRQFTKHRDTKHGDERRFICDTCGCSFKTKPGIFNHIKHVHMSRGITCEYCKRQFRTRLSYRTHVVRHLNPQKHACNKCDVSFDTKMGLVRHYLKYCTQVIYACRLCDKLFDTQSAHDEHKATHFPHQCEVCKKRFLYVQSLRDHMLRHTGTEYICDRCGKKYHLVKSFRNHVNSPGYACTLCENVKFCNMSSKLEHMRTAHRGHRKNLDEVFDEPVKWNHSKKSRMAIKPDKAIFMCEECNQVFTTRYNFDVHFRKVHGVEQLYSCDKCDGSFRTTVQLKRHKSSSCLLSFD